MYQADEIGWLGQYIATLVERNTVIELRALINPYRHRILYLGRTSIKGYPINWMKAVEPLLTKMLTEEGKPCANIYHSLQPLHEGCIARAPYRWELNGKCFSKPDITGIRQLCLDIDVKRPSGVPATDTEHGRALSAADDIVQHLHEQLDVLPFAFIDTGNGAQLIYFVETDLTPDDEPLWRQAIEPIFQLAEQVLPEDRSIMIDRNTTKLAQLVRMPYTLNIKGYEFGTRVHRLARLLAVPNPHAPPIRIKRAEIFSSSTNTAQSAPVSVSSPANGSLTEFIRTVDMLKARLEAIGCEPYYVDQQSPNCYRIRLRVCPFNREHINKAAVFYNEQTEQIGFNCFKCNAEEQNPPNGRHLITLLLQEGKDQ